PRPLREADLQRDRKGRKDGAGGSRDGEVLRDQLQPPFHSGRATRQAVAGRREIRRSSLRQRRALDRQRGRLRFTLLPREGAESALHRRYPPLLRGDRGGPVLRDEGARPRYL